jgi:hypothetical protein
VPAFIESKPDAGFRQFLSENEIRYCLAENIRLDAESAAIAQREKSVNQYRQADIDRFNTVVDAYNARAQDLNLRCSDYRYYESAMTRAKADVERRRPILADEGRARIIGNGPRTAGSSRPTQSGASSKKTKDNRPASSN